MDSDKIAELRHYLRSKTKENNEFFEKIISYASMLLRLRTDAEDRYKKNRHLAYKSKGALPLGWKKIKEIVNPENEAPEENVITQIARKNTRDIELVISNLRKVLIRKRQNVRVSNVQEVDAQCLRWLIRQPGRNVAEKAGTKQRIMAVVRSENFNTLENRVLKELLICLQSYSYKYLRVYENRFQSHKTIKTVKHLIKLCEEGLSLPVMENVLRLKGVPKPNYVLRQDRLYSKIWKAYQLVIKYTKLIESLAKREKLLFNTIDCLREYLTKYDSKKIKYYCPIWFNPIGIKYSEYIDKPCLYNELTENETRLRNVSSKIEKESELVVVDLTGRFARQNILVLGSHTNAKPYLQDFGRPNYEDSQSKNWYTLEKILQEKNVDLLKQYFEQLYGIKKGKFWIILIPDNWDAKWQEQIIRAAKNATRLSRDNIYLLWRSIAAILGVISENDYLISGSKVSVIDLQRGTEGMIYKLQTVRQNGKTLPQRKSYERHKDNYIKIHETIVSTDKNSELLLYGNRKSFFNKNDIERYLRNTNDSNLTIFLGEKFNLLKPEFKDEIKNKFINQKIVFDDSSSMGLAEKGARYFNEQRLLGNITYYDELEELSLVVQRNDETVDFSILVKADEQFPGGNVYNQDEHIRINDVVLGAYEERADFYLCMGPHSPVAKLKHLTQPFEYPPTITQQLSLIPKMTPGQGMAIVEVRADFLKKPITLDFIENMKDTKKTVASIERDMDRSFPPDTPDVCADRYLWLDVDDYITDYICGNIEADGKWFAKAIAMYTQNTLPANASPLDILKRKNVFGNEKGRELPVHDFNYDDLFDRLVYDFEHHRSLDIGGIKANVIRLIAWTYQSDNPKFAEVKKNVLDRIHRYAYKKPLLTPPLNQEYTLCANLCSTPEEWLKCFDSIMNAIDPLVDRAPIRYIRLLYNLLQFHSSFLKETELYKSSECWVMMKMLIDRLKCETAPITQNSILKAMLYLLRCRRFDNKEFLMKNKQSERYEYVIKNVKLSRFDGSTLNLAENFLKYLDGKGKIDGLPQDGFQE